MSSAVKPIKKKKHRKSGAVFEGEIVKALNKYFNDNNILGEARRMRQAKFSSQPIDIHCDSPNKSFYLGIECKSVDLTVEKPPTKLYFNKFFSKTTIKDKMGKEVTVHQVENIQSHLIVTGRRGYLALELINFKPDTKKKRKEAYFIPFSFVWNSYRKWQVGDMSALLAFSDLIDNMPALKHTSLGYIIDKHVLY